MWGMYGVALQIGPTVPRPQGPVYTGICPETSGEGPGTLSHLVVAVSIPESRCKTIGLSLLAVGFNDNSNVVRNHA